MTQSHRSDSATDALFGRPIRPELDPAQLLDELRATRPLLDRLNAVEPVVRALEGLEPAQVQQVRLAFEEHAAMAARAAHAAEQLHRIEDLLTLLDSLDVMIRRQ